MTEDEVRDLIKIAKNLKNKKDKRQITAFEEEELKQIYHLLVVDNEPVVNNKDTKTKL
ncbi:hypothetical protein Halha_1344 [Halobacteroides halobius DSM 5150]|uniref:Uncharacterized protein n=1 Tax=Halobacteroides halobius (strain ATCC 35273 / DSM 5150 / MD-1) TaxID=748449 RepID=L0KAB9_HALHC|nr:hypothetical protein [Halobacteroides halobius]AGB41289.1 hypothetical protein Halha_1344 [Halobacteroides halobius DSM 5150]